MYTGLPVHWYACTLRYILYKVQSVHPKHTNLQVPPCLHGCSVLRPGSGRWEMGMLEFVHRNVFCGLQCSAVQCSAVQSSLLLVVCAPHTSYLGTVVSTPGIFASGTNVVVLALGATALQSAFFCFILRYRVMCLYSGLCIFLCSMYCAPTAYFTSTFSSPQCCLHVHGPHSLRCGDQVP